MTQASTTPGDLAERLQSVTKAQTAVITHHGRKTGKPYKVRVWFTTEGDQLNLGTMDMQRQWPRNVQVNPQITLQIRDQVFHGEVSVLTSVEEIDRVSHLVKRKYPLSIPYFWLKKRLPGAFRVRLTG